MSTLYLFFLKFLPNACAPWSHTCSGVVNTSPLKTDSRLFHSVKSLWWENCSSIESSQTNPTRTVDRVKPQKVGGDRKGETITVCSDTQTESYLREKKNPKQKIQRGRNEREEERNAVICSEWTGKKRTELKESWVWTERNWGRESTAGGEGGAKNY